jgi:DNA mismatch repair protein MutS
MNQLFRELKDRFCGCVMLFQVGDFIYAYGEDADTLSRICDIYCHDPGTSNSSITLPIVTAHSYVQRLVRAGFQVAIANRNAPHLNLN